jgi:mRNA interferase RelE/StbE
VAGSSPPYEVLIKPSAVREIDSIPSRADRRRVVARIEALAVDPRPFGVQKLSGSDKYRIRCGIFRILFAIEDRALVVTIVRVAHRRDAYR